MGISHALAWAGYRYTSTILDDIQHQVTFFTLFALMVCAVSEFTGRNLGINNIMIAVLGTVVSLTVSFKTSSAYTRWWEGRNIWATVTSNSRHLAMLIWLHVPNSKPPPKDEPKSDKKKHRKKRHHHHKSSKKSSRHSLASMAAAPAHTHADSDPEAVETLTKAKDYSTGFTVDTPRSTPLRFEESGEYNEKAQAGPSYPAGLERRPRDFTGSTTDTTTSCMTGLTGTGEIGNEHREKGKKGHDHGLDKVLSKQEEVKMRAQVAGMVEKRTYIGLAFSVAMKHALRGESGPFYTDLYNLIAFLPKYNMSVVPPVNRDHLFTGWNNGIPRQKADYDDDSIAVPLTNPAPFTGYAFELPQADPGDLPPVDEEKAASTGFTTTSFEFRNQALNSATAYIRSEGESRRHCFARLDKKHRVIRKSEDRRRDGVPITTVELMPPRHPPRAQYWDFFPPLRLIKVVTDWIRKRDLVQKQERVRGGKRRRNGGVRSEIPQEIIMYLSAYIDDLVRREMINTSYIGPLMACILEFQKSLTDLEKIATTPIPSAYSFHLRLTVWAYLLFLPFQIYPLLKWVTIPAVAVAAITYLGFLEIGAQIEMPFAYDQSDLDIDKFVLKIAHQLAEVTSFPCDVPSSQIILSHLNQPFYPTLQHSAPELMGLGETKPAPNPLGFSAAFEACRERDVPDLTGKAINDKDKEKNDKEKKEDREKEEKGSTRKRHHHRRHRRHHHSRSHSSSHSESSSGSPSSSSSSGTESESEPSDSEAAKEARAAKVLANKHLKPLTKTVRDLELALTANWKTISTETESFIGKPRQQLENRSGVEVAVMTL